MIKIPVKKCIAAGIVGDVLGVAGQLATNASNERIASQNNSAMLSAMREQTRSEQSYNSVGAQMKRAMAAGLNPMTLAGNQPTSASSTGVPGLQTPDLKNPFSSISYGVDDAVSAMNAAKSIDNQSRQVDVAEMESNISMLKTIGDLMRDTNLTSDDAMKIVNSVLGERSPYQNQMIDLLKDENIKNRLANEIKISDLNVKEKDYLYGWLDEFTNAQYTLILAQTEEKQTGSNVNRSVVDLNKTLQKLNDSKRREVDQAIKNMQEEWKSLNFQGELDAKKLLRVAEICDSIVNDLVNHAQISKQEAEYWVWKELNKVTVSHTAKVGPFSVSRSGSRNDVAPNHPTVGNYNNPTKRSTKNITY